MLFHLILFYANSIYFNAILYCAIFSSTLFRFYSVLFYYCRDPLRARVQAAAGAGHAVQNAALALGEALQDDAKSAEGDKAPWGQAPYSGRW